jgi:hypothetical protein
VSNLPLQQLLLASPLGPQLAVLFTILGLQAPQPHALPELQEPLDISRDIANRSAAYPCLFLGGSTNRLSNPSELERIRLPAEVQCLPDLLRRLSWQ